MKKKLTFIAIFTAVLALSSCVWVDLGEDDYDVKPAATKTGTLNLKLKDEYKNDYYISKVYVWEKNEWKTVWDKAEHENTYKDGAHVNLNAGTYSEIQIAIRNEFDELMPIIYLYNVKINAEKSTEKILSPILSGTLNISLNNTYSNLLYIGDVFIWKNNEWTKVWDAVDYPNTYINGATVKLDQGYYDIKITVYKFKDAYSEKSDLFETINLENVYVLNNNTTTRKITATNPNPGYIKVKIDSEYYNWYYVGDIYIWKNNDWIKVWDAKDYPSTYLNGATLALYEGTYDVKFSIYKCRKNGESRDAFYDDEIEYKVRINAEKDTKFTYGSEGIEKQYW